MPQRDPDAASAPRHPNEVAPSPRLPPAGADQRPRGCGPCCPGLGTHGCGGGCLEDKGVRAAAFKAGQGDAAQVDGLVKAVVQRFGRLDILVNNAGVFVTGSD